MINYEEHAELVRKAQLGDKECLNRLAEAARVHLREYVLRLTLREDLTLLAEWSASMSLPQSSCTARRAKGCASLGNGLQSWYPAESTATRSARPSLSRRDCKSARAIGERHRFPLQMRSTFTALRSADIRDSFARNGTTVHSP